METNNEILNAENVKTESVKENSKKVKIAIAKEKADKFVKSEFQKSIDKLNLQTASKQTGSNYDHNYLNIKFNLKFKYVAENCEKIGMLTADEIKLILSSIDFGKEKISRGDFKSLYKKMRTFYRLQRDEKNNMKLTSDERKVHESNYLFYRLISEKKADK